MKDIGQILTILKTKNPFPTIIREKYKPYDIESALSIIEVIGKSRNPGFVIDDDNRFTYTNMIRWCHNDPAMECINPDNGEIIRADLKKGIYIAGNTGTGKSWCLEIMSEYALLMDSRIKFGDGFTRGLAWKNIRTDIICDAYTSNGILENYKKAPIIGLQDLGSEPIESLFMGNRVNVMRQLLEYRGDRQDEMTLITSNIPMAHKLLKDKYDVRVTSRLYQMCNYFTIKGKDRRRG